MGTISKSELNEMIREQLESVTGDISKNVSDELKKVFDKPIGNKLIGTWPGEDNKPKQKFTSYNDNEIQEDGSFKNLGHFLKAVRNNDLAKLGNLLPETKDIRTDVAPGSFIVPAKFENNIIQFMAEESLVMPRAKQYKLGHNEGLTLKIPAYDAYDFTDNAVSGIKMYFRAEGATISETEPKLRQVELRLHKIAGIVDVTDESLLSNSVNIDSMLSELIGRALSWTLDRYMIKDGVGSGQPLAVVNGNDFVSVGKEVGQTEGFIADNSAEMLKHLYPEAWGKALFISSVSLIKDLMASHFNIGVSALPILPFNFSTQKFNLLGIELKFSQHATNTGSANCLMLADFSRYAVLSRDTLLVKFDPYTKAGEGLNRYIFSYYVDGQSLDSNKTTLADSVNTMTSFCGLSATT